MHSNWVSACHRIYSCYHSASNILLKALHKEGFAGVPRNDTIHNGNFSYAIFSTLSTVQQSSSAKCANLSAKMPICLLCVNSFLDSIILVFLLRQSLTVYHRCMASYVGHHSNCQLVCCMSKTLLTRQQKKKD